MKKTTLLVFHQGEALSEFELVLQRFGFDVQICSRLEQVPTLARKQSPDLVILDQRLKDKQKVKKPETGGLEMASAHFGETPDLLAVHEFLQKNLKNYSRKHPRMEVDLPGVFSRQGASHIASIRNLGTGGVFIKSGCNSVAEGDTVEISLPLLGLKKELELQGRVVYLIRPGHENNYLHGFGVRFLPLDKATEAMVREYLSYSLHEAICISRETARNDLRDSGFGPKTHHTTPARSIQLGCRS